MTIIDTNIIIRIIVQDNPTLTEKALQIVETDECYVSTMVVAESIFTLQHHYGFDKKDMIKLRDFLMFSGLVVEDKWTVLKTLEDYSRENIEFVDLYLLHKTKSLNIQLGTLDKKLKSKFLKT